jgi:hypothetical protein
VSNNTTDVRLLILAAAVCLIAFLTVWFFYPWLWVEATMSSNGYTIEGCENRPPLILSGSVYDCTSNARQRYKRYIRELAK